jgi:hypothetical protein
MHFPVATGKSAAVGIPGQNALVRSKALLYSLRHRYDAHLIGTKIRLMSELHEVHQRLEAALGRLDSAIRSRLDPAGPQARIDSLSKELERAAADHAKLQDTTTAVARGLDMTIERIRKILGE